MAWRALTSFPKQPAKWYRRPRNVGIRLHGDVWRQLQTRRLRSAVRVHLDTMEQRYNTNGINAATSLRYVA